MVNKASSSRAVLMGLLFAMVGFTFALASSRSIDSVNAGAGSRAAGSSTLRFLNKTVSSVGDLGDVVKGSYVLRYVRATGGAGVLKYASTFSPTLKSVLSATTEPLLSNGAFAGTGVLIPTTAVSPLLFTVDVTDQAAGTGSSSARGNFSLTLDATGFFKFAITNLGEAVQFQSFTDIVSTINGGSAPVITASSVKLDGTAVTGGLEELGLSLASDGTLAGVPLKSGVLTFTASGKDAKGGAAKNRVGTATGETITLTISGNSEISTQAVCTGLQLKIATPTGSAASSSTNKDTLKYAGQVNLGSRLVSDLDGDALTVTVGGYTTPNTTNTPATLSSGKTAKVAKSTSAKLVASVNQKGQVKVAVSAEDMSRVSAFSSTTGAQRLAIGVRIGDAIAAAQVLDLAFKSGSKGITAAYKLDASNTPGGAFIVTAVKSKDDKSTVSDSWAASFVAIPQTGASFTGATSAAISIGKSYTDSIDVKEAKSKVQQNEKVSSKTAFVTQIKLDGVKGKGSLKTGPLLASATGIAQAAGSGKSDSFPLSISLLKSTTTLYTGTNSLAILAGKTGWSSRTK